MENTLSEKKILITRASSQAKPFQKKLDDLGAQSLVIPTIAIGPPPSWNPFDQAAQKASCFNWILFTSTNAVKQTLERLQEQNLSLEKDFPQIKIAVVGDKTAKSLSKKKWPVDLIPEDFQAEGVYEALMKEGLKGKKIWFPRALEAREWLPEKLTESGVECLITPVYQNRLPEENRESLQQAILNGSLDWITFTSSSTVTNFFQLLESIPKTLPKIASIGKITTETLRENNVPPTFTADPQNLDGLIEGMIRIEGRISQQDKN